MSKWNKIIVITPKTNRKFQCEFTISVYETPADETNPHPRTIGGPSREFKSPVRAVKYLEALLAENEDIGVSKNSGPSYNQLYHWAQVWAEEAKAEKARRASEQRRELGI